MSIIFVLYAAKHFTKEASDWIVMDQGCWQILVLFPHLGYPWLLSLYLRATVFIHKLRVAQSLFQGLVVSL